MNLKILVNGIILLIMYSIPMLAEIIGATSNHVPPTGINILFYKPFDFAYLLMTFIILLIANIILIKKMNTTVRKAIRLSIGLIIIWFLISSISIIYLHLALGGNL